MRTILIMMTMIMMMIAISVGTMLWMTYFVRGTTLKIQHRTKKVKL